MINVIHIVVISRYPEIRAIMCINPCNNIDIVLPLTPHHQVAFNSQGTQILTASADKTARIWDPNTGQNMQVLEGHTDEIFSCSYNYEGNIIITGKALSH